MSDDTDDEVPSGPPSSRRKSKKRLISSESSSSNSSSSPVVTSKRKANYRIGSDDSDSDSGSSIVDMRKRKKVARITSDSEDSDSSDSIIIRRVKPSANIVDSEDEDQGFKGSSSQWETDVSDNEVDDNNVRGTSRDAGAATSSSTSTSTSKKEGADAGAETNGFESDASDGQSEKCPICLIPIRRQELGTPESCDHLFCVECILEWSKNMNTCPVDRQEYHLILVRKRLNGKIVRQIPVEKPAPLDAPPEDPTFCEICGSGDREDRLLLCDGCDLGFHLECLTPPLQEVPPGLWYCNECDPDDHVEREMDAMEVHLLLEDQEMAVATRNVRNRERDDQRVDSTGSVNYLRPRTTRSSTTRLIPRTRQSERIRSRIMHNRSNREPPRQQDDTEEPTSSTQPTIETARRIKKTKKSSRNTRRRRRRAKTKSAREPKYRMVYEVDDDTGEIISTKRQLSRNGKMSRKAAKNRRNRVVRRPKTVKKRLARQLGICPMKVPAQSLPDVRLQNHDNGGLNSQRHQAGIPALHLFGQRDDLDYFSASEDDLDAGGPDYLVSSRRPNRSDVASFRRAARRKGALLLLSSPPSAVSSTTTDLLDSILDAQTKLYSKKTKFSVDTSGKFKMEDDMNNKNVNNNNNNNGDELNLTDFNKLTRKTPYGGNSGNNGHNGNNGRRNHYPYSNPHHNRGSYYYDNYIPSSTSENYNMSFGNARGRNNRHNDNFDQDMPQDYTQSTLSSYDRDLEFENSRRNNEEQQQQQQQQQQDDSDIDIYSDIEDSVSTSRVDDDNVILPLNLAPSSVVPQLASNIGLDFDNNDNNDSDNDMVIDTDKVDAQAPEETTKEETAVTSSVDSTIANCGDSTGDATASVAPHSTSEIQSEAVQSSFEKNKNDEEEEDEDADSEDGCPNFSIYSSESINLAKNTDVTLNNADDNEENDKPSEESVSQVVSTTPTEVVEQSKVAAPTEGANNDVYDPETAYDPEAAFLSDKDDDNKSERNSDDAYDPERACDTPEDAYDPEKTFDDENDDEEASANLERPKEDGKEGRDDDVKEKEGETKVVQDEKEPQDKVVGEDIVAVVESARTAEEEEKEPDGKMEESEEVPVLKEKEEEEPATTTATSTIPSEQDVVPSVKPIVVHSVIKVSKPKNFNVLYSDSEDEEVVKINKDNLPISDIRAMTSDVSEEERSYTPCLDEKMNGSKGVDGLDTEMISDDEKNDFEESHEQKVGFDGDALEINAKESEMEMTRTEDYEEGEIVDKNKANVDKEPQNLEQERQEDAEQPENVVAVEIEPEKDAGEDKENQSKEKQPFKKLSKNNRERNYRDKDRSKSREGKSRQKEKNKETVRGRKRDKRKEIERYDVRALIAEKPRRLKDRFGRDIRKSSSRSRSKSRSYTPKSPAQRHTSPGRRQSSESRADKRKSNRRSPSKSRSRSRVRKRSKSKRRRSSSRSKKKGKSKDRTKKKKRQRSSSRTFTPTRKRRKDWEESAYNNNRERGYEVEGGGRWTPSPSRSPEMETALRASPSWTPPRLMESAAVDPRNLTVILQNDQNKKKKDKKKKNNGKKEADRGRGKKRRKDRTPPPSKEVFASGDNILVSVSFNKENERERDVFTKKKKEADERERRKKIQRRQKKNQEISGMKPVAIIDLDRSPFRELTPSPKDVIVLSDDEHVEIDERGNVNDTQDVCDSSQQVASPENDPVYVTGPKTPPEPQVKFSLQSKQQNLRPLLANPLHDPEDEMLQDDDEDDDDRQNDVEREAMMMELGDSHKGPNTPPEPPNSPPSSPDAYDPFEPTKSRSPSPDNNAEVTVVEEDDEDDDVVVSGVAEKRTSSDAVDKIKNASSAPSGNTPPTMADVQPADSQSSVALDSSPVTSVAIAQAPIFGAVAGAVTSTPVITASNSIGRINILNTTILSNVSSTIPQRMVLPNVKLSPVKISPVKNVIKSTPIKPMPNKTANVNINNNNNSSKNNKSSSKSKGDIIINLNDSGDNGGMDFDSPYSPGSSDYEDLFEPPPEVVTKKTLSNKSATSSVPVKEQQQQTSAGGGGVKSKSTFDTLFGSPIGKIKKAAMDNNRSKTLKKSSRGTKIVGVKLDEDHLKILDELPSSAVEMQFLKKLNRQERVVEEVKLVLKPYYNKKKISKEEYKDIMRRAVPKICHNKTGEINPTRIKNLIEAYVKKIRHSKPKVTSSSSYNPLKN